MLEKVRTGSSFAVQKATLGTNKLEFRISYKHGVNASAKHLENLSGP